MIMSRRSVSCFIFLAALFANLVERDRSAFVDDWIRIMLDTFDDHRQAYVFYVNPLGIRSFLVIATGGLSGICLEDGIVRYSTGH